MKIRKVMALVTALAIVFTFAACGGGDIEETTDLGENMTATVTVGGTEQAVESQTISSVEEEIQDNDEPVSKPESAGLSGDVSSDTPVNTKRGLNSTDTKTVLDFYKKAARETETIDAEQHMNMGSIDFTPRNSFEKRLLTFFESIASAGFKAHSTPRTDVPGDHQKLQTSDLNSANAIVSGPYTIVTLSVKSQEDNKDVVDDGLGPVGHAVGTIGDLNQVFDAMSAILVDLSHGDIVLRYDNCKVVVKINNETGKIETGIWSYTVNVTLTDIYAIFPESDELILNDMSGSVHFDVKTNDQKK